MNIKEALAELRKNEKRKFDQSIDLVVNLKGIDAKKDNVSTIVNLPNPIREKKVCGFFSKKSSLIDTVTQLDFPRYKDKKQLKILVKKYDFFVAEPKLMPSVATTFGKVLGPAGKMPSPQLGVLMQEGEQALKEILEKISTALKIRVKENSFKVSVGKEKMSDEKIIGNIEAVYSGLVNALPTKRENVKSVMLKLTMSKPIKVEIK